MPLTTNNTNSGYCNNKATVGTPKTVDAANEAYICRYEMKKMCSAGSRNKKAKTQAQIQQTDEEEAIDAVVRAFKWCTHMSAMSCRRMRATDRIRRMSTDRPTAE